MAKIKVVVVDDSALVRSLLTEIINRQPDMECIGAASDPLVAREMIRELNPDVITLDVEMPRMDGLEFLSRLMRLRPMPVVMVSTLTEQGAEITLRALEMGAVDYVAKPRIGISSGLQELATDIVDKIRVAAGAHVKRLGPAPATTPAAAAGAAPSHSVSEPPRAPLPRLSTEKIICIGASTGGTEAIREVLVPMPADSPAIVITQHMPPGFTTSFAARLNSLCRINVEEARHGQRMSTERAYLRRAMQRPNLQVISGAQVTRILMQGTKAQGVSWLQNGHSHSLHARHEVVLCAGAIQSPQLLQLSGMGPGALLARHQIAPVVDLPGVGENLQDHLQVRPSFRCQGVETLNDVANSRWRSARDFLRYQLTRSGLEAATRVVRLHRLWELYLSRHLNIAPDHVHEDAEGIEHLITPELERELDDALHRSSARKLRRCEWLCDLHPLCCCYSLTK